MSADPRAYLDIETSLTKRLWKSWRTVSAEFWTKIDHLLDKGDVAQAYSVAQQIDLQPVVDANREYVKYLLLQAAVFGAGMANDNHRVSPVALGTYEQLLNRVSDVFCASILRNTTLAVHDQLLQLIAQHDPQHVQKAEGQPRFVKDYVLFREAGDRHLEMLTTLNTSRLAAWGFTAEAEVLGLQRYVLSAILDGRTSAFCRMIDGRTFDVAQARTRVVNALAATTPDDLRVLQPWPNQSRSSIAELRGLSTTELAARGYSVPPFHPYCRTICRREKSAVNTTVADVQTASPVVSPEMPRPQEQPQPQRVPQTAEAFNAIGAELTPEQLQFWNDEIGQSPVSVVSQLTGEQPADLLDTEAGKGISVTADGEVKIKVGGALAGEDSRVAAAVKIDPLTSVLEVQSAAVAGASPAKAAAYVKTLYDGAISVAAASGVGEVAISAGGTGGGYAAAQMGFVPNTDGEWYDLKIQIEHELDGGDLQDVRDALTDDQNDLLDRVLASPDRQALWVLSDLPWLVGGERVGERLLEGQQFDASLDLNDSAALTRYGDHG